MKKLLDSIQENKANILFEFVFLIVMCLAMYLYNGIGIMGAVVGFVIYTGLRVGDLLAEQLKNKFQNADLKMRFALGFSIKPILQFLLYFAIMVPLFFAVKFIFGISQ
jgi:hypothetical protein